MNLYLKAAILTFLIFLLGLFLAQQMDSLRFNDLQSQVDSEVLELNSTKLSFLFLQLFEEDFQDTELCSIVEQRIDFQARQTFELVQNLENSKKNSLLADYDLLKKKYYLKNAELFLYFKQAEKTCGKTELIPILYFYPDKTDCPDCKVQAAILDKTRDECGTVRVFAFPTDLDIEIISLIKSKYGIRQEPSIVLNEKTFSGIQTEQKIKQEIQCS
ncbi:MAG: hypothetical protein ABIA76_03930 [Candidatus Diapherotrites archaeon]